MKRELPRCTDLSVVSQPTLDQPEIASTKQLAVPQTFLACSTTVAFLRFCSSTFNVFLVLKHTPTVHGPVVL